MSQAARRGSQASDTPTGLGWALLSIALALPWLLSTHTAPWTMFHAEWLMAAASLPLVAWAAHVRPAPWKISGPVLALGLFALLPLAHAASGMLAYAADGWLGALYLVGLFLAAATGMRGEALQANRVGDAVFSSLVIAAIASTGLMLYQWVQLSHFGMLVLTLPIGGRLVANLGQPNLLATLLVWGLLGLWWGLQRGRIGAPVGMLAAAFLLTGVAATQSRTGMVGVAILAIVGLIARPQQGQPRRVAVLVLLGWFVTVVLSWPTWTSLLQLQEALSLQQQAELSRRPLIWRLALSLITERPLLGWGWNQTVAAQLAMIDTQAPLHLVLPYMHNVALDLSLWFGLPIGLLATVSMLTWYAFRWRHHVPAQRPLLLALTVLLVHAMLELPHAYALFLLPAALMLGVIEQQSERGTRMTMPRTVPIGLAVGLAISLALLAADYLRVESDLRDTRMRAARIGDLTPVEVPTLHLLVPFSDLLHFLRVDPAAGLSDDELSTMRRVAERFPSGPNLFRYAQAAALNHRLDESRRALILLCHLMPTAECRAAGGAWREIGKLRHPVMLSVEPPSP